MGGKLGITNDGYDVDEHLADEPFNSAKFRQQSKQVLKTLHRQSQLVDQLQTRTNELLSRPNPADDISALKSDLRSIQNTARKNTQTITAHKTRLATLTTDATSSKSEMRLHKDRTAANFQDLERKLKSYEILLDAALKDFATVKRLVNDGGGVSAGQQSSSSTEIELSSRLQSDVNSLLSWKNQMKNKVKKLEKEMNATFMAFFETQSPPATTNNNDLVIIREQINGQRKENNKLKGSIEILKIHLASVRSRVHDLEQLTDGLIAGQNNVLAVG